MQGVGAETADVVVGDVIEDIAADDAADDSKTAMSYRLLDAGPSDSSSV